MAPPSVHEPVESRHSTYQTLEERVDDQTRLWMLHDGCATTMAVSSVRVLKQCDLEADCSRCHDPVSEHLRDLILPKLSLQNSFISR